MKVKDLIIELQKLPLDMSVYYVWDGDARSKVEGIYESESNKIILFTYDEYVSAEDRPKGMKADRYNAFWFDSLGEK